ncbi:MAG: glycosyltransferase family 2 protein [Burkholderiales bacterium]
MPSTSALALAVVVPVHNETENLAPLIGEIHAALEGRIDFEIVYVDDGSSDETPQLLAALAAKHPRLRVFRHLNNCGQSTAVRTGVRQALAPLVATLDGDGQNDPVDIPALLEKYRSERSLDPRPLLIAGQRAKRRDTTIRRLSSRIANGVRAWLLNDATPDTGCGLKLFAREDFLALPFFDHLHRFLPALFIREGGRVVSVPVNHRPRERGQSHYGVWNRLWVGIVDIAGVLWLKRRGKVPVVAPVPSQQGESSRGT